MFRNERDTRSQVLGDKERQAVAVLLHYLENVSFCDNQFLANTVQRDEHEFFNSETLTALTTLVDSNNLELQRSAALAFAEITEKNAKPVSYETLEPILQLLQNPDVEVQRAAGAAIGNLAVNSTNKRLIVEMGGLEPLTRQMLSPNVEVQCNAVGCMTNLATHEDNKDKIMRSGALQPLIKLAKSKDMRVQRNATGALLNMTHSDENRRELVKVGAIPVLVSQLSSSDPDVQYYCTTALSNIAVDPENRENLSKTEPRLVSHFIQLMGLSTSPRVRCQAALALRNLASDVNYQLEIVRCNGLPHLLPLMQSDQLSLVVAAVACLRNVSIHQSNEKAIVEAGFLEPLVDLLGKFDNEEIECHTVSTLRNLAAPSDENKLAIVEAGAVQKCKATILSAPLSVQSEMSAFLAVLALSNELKPALFKLGIIDVLIPLTKSESIEIQGNSAAALSNLSSKAHTYDSFVTSWNQPDGGIAGFLAAFLTSKETTFEHISLWMILQLLESGDTRLKELVLKSTSLLETMRKLTSKDASADQNGGGDGGLASSRAVPTLAKTIVKMLETK